MKPGYGSLEFYIALSDVLVKDFGYPPLKEYGEWVEQIHDHVGEEDDGITVSTESATE